MPQEICKTGWLFLEAMQSEDSIPGLEMLESLRHLLINRLVPFNIMKPILGLEMVVSECSITRMKLSVLP